MTDESLFPPVQYDRILLTLALEPVLIEVDREHEEQDEDRDPLRDVGELAAVDRHVCNVAALEEEHETDQQQDEEARESRSPGSLLMKSAIGPAKISISATEITTEPTITRKMSVMPTTVRIESTENSRLRLTIVNSTLPKARHALHLVLDALDLEPQLLDAGPDQEQPTTDEDDRLAAERALEVDSQAP